MVIRNWLHDVSLKFSMFPVCSPLCEVLWRIFFPLCFLSSNAVSKVWRPACMPWSPLGSHWRPSWVQICFLNSAWRTRGVWMTSMMRSVSSSRSGTYRSRDVRCVTQFPTLWHNWQSHSYFLFLWWISFKTTVLWRGDLVQWIDLHLIEKSTFLPSIYNIFQEIFTDKSFIVHTKALLKEA